MQKMTHRITDKLRRLQFDHHDACSSCGHVFEEGETTHSGYDQADLPAYLCDSCSGQLKETAVRHYYIPHPFETPGSDALLWRYMDFTKYVSLISTKKLYFPRADKLNDPFEGVKGLRTKKPKWDAFYLEFFNAAMKNPPEGYESDLTEQEIEEHAKKLLRRLEARGDFSLLHTYISCWHENENESEAMWKLYSSFIDNAVAIQTTYQRLYEALGKSTSILIGRVKYIDFSRQFAGLNEAFWRKRKSLEHEKEVRAIITDYNTEDDGLGVDCDLDKLIEKVLISPTSPDWFFDLVRHTSKTFGVSSKILRSRLFEPTFR